MRLLYAALLVAATTSAALAQGGPEIVIPGRPDVPVFINGIDASWGIVEGEFGLDRPGMVPTVIYRPPLIAAPYRVPAYYPADGRRPGYGRFEIVPPPDRRLPPPAPTYYRDWSAESELIPATQNSARSAPQIAIVSALRNRAARARHQGGAGHRTR